MFGGGVGQRGGSGSGNIKGREGVAEQSVLSLSLFIYIGFLFFK